MGEYLQSPGKDVGKQEKVSSGTGEGFMEEVARERTLQSC